jgi:glycosyltransferase involved in cell wall biosynthesis
MKIAFAAISDLTDVRRGSGTYFHMANELERQGHVVTRIGPVPFDVPLISRGVRGISRRLGRRHPMFLDPFVGKRTGAEVARRLATVDHDVLLTNDMAIAAYTPSRKPVVLYTDAMITPDYSERRLAGSRLGNQSWMSLAMSRKTVRDALERSALAVFPAEWSAQAARVYSPTVEIRTIPFGANIDDPGQEIAAARSWQRVTAKGTIDLLFVGKDWIRKGGEVAVETVNHLNAGGVSATLHVVGADVPAKSLGPKVRSCGLLDKSNPAELERLRRLFIDADAFILPSSSEGAVISVLEAAAFGLPTLAYQTDGVTGVVLDGQTGRLLPLGSSGTAFADVIKSWAAHPNEYDTMSRAARERFETTANWPACVRQLTAELSSLVTR